MSLPTVVSLQSPSTPVVETKSRRSQRKKIAKGGFSHTWLDKNPTKKQKIMALQINNSSGEVGPI
jgi:hypothetical protein